MITLVTVFALQGRVGDLGHGRCGIRGNWVTKLIPHRPEVRWDYNACCSCVNVEVKFPALQITAKFAIKYCAFRCFGYVSVPGVFLDRLEIVYPSW